MWFKWISRKARDFEMIILLIKVSELFGIRVSVGFKLVNQVAIKSEACDSFFRWLKINGNAAGSKGRSDEARK